MTGYISVHIKVEPMYPSIFPSLPVNGYPRNRMCVVFSQCFTQMIYKVALTKGYGPVPFILWRIKIEFWRHNILISIGRSVKDATAG